MRGPFRALWDSAEQAVTARVQQHAPPVDIVIEVEERRPPPPRKNPAGRSKEESVCVGQPRLMDLVAQDGKLVARYHDLEVLRVSRTKTQHHEFKDASRQRVEKGNQHARSPGLRSRTGEPYDRGTMVRCPAPNWPSAKSLVAESINYWHPTGSGANRRGARRHPVDLETLGTRACPAARSNPGGNLLLRPGVAEPGELFLLGNPAQVQQSEKREHQHDAGEDERDDGSPQGDLADGPEGVRLEQ